MASIGRHLTASDQRAAMASVETLAAMGGDGAAPIGGKPSR